MSDCHLVSAQPGPSPAPGSQPGFPASSAAASSAEKDPSRVWETVETSSGHADTGRNLQSVTNCHPNNSFLWNKSHQPAPAAAGSRALYQTPSKVKKIAIVSDDEEELYDDVLSHAPGPAHSELYDDVRRPLSQSQENLTKPGGKSPSKLSASADNLLELEVYDDVGDLRPVSSEAAAQFAEAPVLVTARPAVVVEEEDSLGAEQQLEAEQQTLYESIAGSLLRLDKLEVSNHLHAVSRLLAKIINPSLSLHHSTN